MEQIDHAYDRFRLVNEYGGVLLTMTGKVGLGVPNNIELVDPLSSRNWTFPDRGTDSLPIPCHVAWKTDMNCRSNRRLVAVIYGTLAKNRWGINLGSVSCPRCNTLLPQVRKPPSLQQSMWGGCTCPDCGVEVYSGTRNKCRQISVSVATFPITPALGDNPLERRYHARE